MRNTSSYKKLIDNINVFFNLAWGNFPDTVNKSQDGRCYAHDTWKPDGTESTFWPHPAAIPITSYNFIILLLIIFFASNHL